MRKSVILVATILLPLALAAQDAPKAEIFGGYSYLRNSSNSLNGWEGQATANFGRYLGVTADVSGHYRTVATLSGIPGVSASANQRLYNFLFGPTVTARFDKHAVFAHALFGAAHSSLGAGVSIPIIGAVSTRVNSATAFAMAFGGGVDIGLTNTFAIRPAQIDYLYTRFNSVDALSTGLSSSTSGHQNSFRYSAGIVIRF
jgi:opacity protein-like surface antigen